MYLGMSRIQKLQDLFNHNCKNLKHPSMGEFFRETHKIKFCRELTVLKSGGNASNLPKLDVFPHPFVLRGLISADNSKKDFGARWLMFLHRQWTTRIVWQTCRELWLAHISGPPPPKRLLLMYSLATSRYIIKLQVWKQETAARTQISPIAPQPSWIYSDVVLCLFVFLCMCVYRRDRA